MEQKLEDIMEYKCNFNAENIYHLTITKQLERIKDICKNAIEVGTVEFPTSRI